MRSRHYFILSLVLSIGMNSWNGCAPKEKPHWYRGNLHTHTTYSDGDTQPEGVVRWYKDNGYDFLAITDHNFLTRVEDYRDDIDDGFILISGNEVSDNYGDKALHLLALGLYDETVKPTGGDGVLTTLQNNVDAIRRAGAVPILAHPNFKWAFGAEELTGIEDCVLFEVLNAHPAVNNQGAEDKPSTEEMWDTTLSAGKRMYGIGTDDTHKLATFPGKSWIMVKAGELTEKAILDALEIGDFYVSTGVYLDRYEGTKSAVKIWIHPDGGRRYTTSFIGQGGRILKQSDSMNPIYEIEKGTPYVRSKIVDSSGCLALTQPVFFD